MKIKDLLVICKSQVDGRKDDYAAVWKDIREALQSMPLGDIEAIMNRIRNDEATDLIFTSIESVRIRKWLEKYK
jgi:hypothetical protein